MTSPSTAPARGDAGLPWRNYLTADERQVIAQADAAKEEWQRLNAARAGIVNLAIYRAKYARRLNAP